MNSKHLRTTKFVKPVHQAKQYRLECRIHPGAVVYCRKSGSQYCPKCRSCCFSCTGGADPIKSISEPKRPVDMNRTRPAREQLHNAEPQNQQAYES